MQIKDLKQDKRNYRKHNQRNLDLIKKSVTEVGLGRSVVIDNENEIVCGNGLVSTLDKNTPIKVIETDGSELVVVKRTDLATNDDKRKQLAVMDNSTSDSSEFDFELLQEDFDTEQLDDWGIDADFEIEEEEKEVIEDEVPEEVETRCKLGDLWQLGEHRLMCGDSTKVDDVEKLMNGEKADMVFTDPPFPNNSNIMQEMIKNIEKAFINARNVCAGVSMWFWDNLEFPPFNEKVTAKYIWHKTNGWQANHFEEIYVFHNDNVRHEQIVFSECNVGVDNERNKIGNHPTPKPIKLFCNIVHTTGLNGNKVLDLFGGSGSTLIACEQLNRKCYTMELDEHYCDVIIQRWENLTGKKAVKID